MDKAWIQAFSSVLSSKSTRPWPMNSPDWISTDFRSVRAFFATSMYSADNSSLLTASSSTEVCRIAGFAKSISLTSAVRFIAPLQSSATIRLISILEESSGEPNQRQESPDKLAWRSTFSIVNRISGLSF